jgi:hypothetical protein
MDIMPQPEQQPAQTPHERPKVVLGVPKKITTYLDAAGNEVDSPDPRVAKIIKPKQF